MKEKVVLGLSGGVDSAVALVNLINEGYEVIAVFMRNWDSFVNADILGNPTIDDEICTQEKDYMDAKKIAEDLKVEFRRIDFTKEYWDEVFSYFIKEYEKGRTPNPDILCNTEIKFKAFLKYAMSLDAKYIAMGHYAQIEEINGLKVLKKGFDINKDQTYFLSQLTQTQIDKALFPIGHINKDEVRKIAHNYKFEIADKKDSTGICFIGERRFNEFLSNYIFAKPGKMTKLDGTYLKDHEGLMYYTIGQRKGLGIGGKKEYSEKPWFVVGKDIKENALLVEQGFHHPYLYSDKCIVKDVIFRGEKNLTDRTFSAKFRYRQEDNPVNLKWLDEATLEVSYPQGVRAVTPGQAAAFYEEDVCVGGGFIDTVYKENTKLKV